MSVRPKILWSTVNVFYISARTVKYSRGICTFFALLTDHYLYFASRNFQFFKGRKSLSTYAH